MAATSARRRLFRGSTSQLVSFRLEDSAVTTGAGKTAIAYNTGTPKAYYSIDGAAPVAITLADGVVGTWSSGGFKEVDATNAPGMYELGIPDAALSSAGKSVHILLTGFTGASPAEIIIELVSINEQAGRLPY